MKLQIRDNNAILEGYICVAERNSNVLVRQGKQFIEQVKSGVFNRALDNADNVYLLKNHDYNSKLGSIKDGNLELREDSIGLHFKAKLDTYDDVVQRAMTEDIYCSFGFIPRKQEVRDIDGMEHRYIEEMDLREVTLLVGINPAYSCCLVETRGEIEEVEIRSLDKITVEDTREKVEVINDKDYTLQRKQIELLKLKK